MKNNTTYNTVNFNKVYQYIDDQIKMGNTNFYKCDSYELYLNEVMEISFKKDGWTLSIITKEKGIVSLAKRIRDNDRILKETNYIFCKILLLAEKKLD